MGQSGLLFISLVDISMHGLSTQKSQSIDWLKFV